MPLYLQYMQFKAKVCGQSVLIFLTTYTSGLTLPGIAATSQGVLSILHQTS